MIAHESLDVKAGSRKKTLRAILVCPRCRQPLEWGTTRCSCVECGTEYPIENGVPTLLPGSSVDTVGGANLPENAQLRASLRSRPWLRRLVDAARPPLPYDRHGRWEGQRAFEAALPRTAADGALLLDLGAGEGRDDQLAGLSVAARAAMIRTDIHTTPTVDFVADAHQIPLPSNVLDGVIIQGVVEHVARPWEIAEEITRVLRPGGVVFCEAPFVQWYHDDPSDYYRFTEHGLREIFRGCDRVDSGVAIGPVSGVIGVGRELIPSLFTSAYVYWPLKWMLGWVSYPFILADRLFRKSPRAKVVALAVYLVARKRKME